MLKFTDERVKWVSELLQGMKMIKFYAYENSFLQKLAAIRECELKELRVLAYMKVSTEPSPCVAHPSRWQLFSHPRKPTRQSCSSAQRC